MIYVLAQIPTGPKMERAYEALENAFGSRSFTYGQAVTVLRNEFDEYDVSSMIRRLEDGGTFELLDSNDEEFV